MSTGKFIGGMVVGALVATLITTHMLGPGEKAGPAHRTAPSSGKALARGLRARRAARGAK